MILPIALIVNTHLFLSKVDGRISSKIIDTGSKKCYFFTITNSLITFSMFRTGFICRVPNISEAYAGVESIKHDEW